MPESDIRTLSEIEELQKRVEDLEKTMADFLEFISILMHDLKSNEVVKDVRVIKNSEGNVEDVVIKEKPLSLTNALTGIEIMMVRKGTYQQIGKKPRIGASDVRT